MFLFHPGGTFCSSRVKRDRSHLYGNLRLCPRFNQRSGSYPADTILRAAGCEIIRAEKASGNSRTGRSELQLLLKFLRPGDTLMVTRVDRLARSIKDLQDIVYALNQQGVTLRATETARRHALGSR